METEERRKESQSSRHKEHWSPGASRRLNRPTKNGKERSGGGHGEIEGSSECGQDETPYYMIAMNASAISVASSAAADNH